MGHGNSAYSEAQVDPRMQEFEADMGNMVKSHFKYVEATVTFHCLITVR